MAAEPPPFAGEEWVRNDDAKDEVFVRVGTGDRWAYEKREDIWLWRWSCTDDQWNAVLAAISELPLLLPADLDATREEYNEAASDYLALVFYHRSRFAEGSPVEAWRKRCKHLEASLEGITIEKQPLFWLEVNKALDFAKAAVVACEMEGSIHHGRSPERDWLYSRLMDIWTRHFGGELTTGRPSNTTPGKRVPDGPTIRFLLAALTPILREDMIGAEAVKKIIQATR